MLKIVAFALEKHQKIYAISKNDGIRQGLITIWRDGGESMIKVEGTELSLRRITLFSTEHVWESLENSGDDYEILYVVKGNLFVEESILYSMTVPGSALLSISFDTFIDSNCSIVTSGAIQV